MNKEQTYSRALPEAMGYTVTMDETLMLVGKAGTMQAWNPRDDSAQCFEVQCWLMALPEYDGLDKDTVHASGRRMYNAQHTNTPASLRAAIVEAAERVADAKGEK